jgi:hypothetical protein
MVDDGFILPNRLGGGSDFGAGMPMITGKTTMPPTTGRGPQTKECPAVGSPLGALSPAAFRLDRVVEFAERHLPLDVVYVSELRDGRQLYRAVAGHASSFDIVVGEYLSAQAIFDQLMLAGQIPSVIRDVSSNSRIAELAVRRAARVGAYVGVPLRYPGEHLYGTISAASHRPVHSLDEGAARLLSRLGELISMTSSSGAQ